MRRAGRHGGARDRVSRGRVDVGRLRRAALHAAQAPPAPAGRRSARRRPPLARGGVILTETALPGVHTIDIEPQPDERGFFARVWDGEVLAAAGLDARVSQSSIAYNHEAGTLPGLHFQRPPHAETKLVRCTRGAIYDVVVDIRPDSESYLQWLGVELTEENRRTLYIPEGFAHG